MTNDLEYCEECDEPTGRAGRLDDSLYVGDAGPFCEGCFDIMAGAVVPDAQVGVSVSAAGTSPVGQPPFTHECLECMALLTDAQVYQVGGRLKHISLEAWASYEICGPCVRRER